MVNAMKKTSSTFAKLHSRNFGVGSIYDQMKIGKPDEFDIDLLLKLPNDLLVDLNVDAASGFVQLQIQNFSILAGFDPHMYSDMKKFIDERNYLLSKEMMDFIFDIFEDAVSNYFPNRLIKVGDEEYKISQVTYTHPALTFTIEVSNVLVSIDLVASFVLNKNYWTKIACSNNSCLYPSDFFVVPARPLEEHVYRERLWRLSFHIQERQLVFNRYRMKPAIRVLKRIRDHFGQRIQSYAIKTLFLREEYYHGTQSFNRNLWKAPLSFIVIYMLEKYLKCLTEGKIIDFWNPKCNLLTDLSDDQIKQYSRNIAEMIEAIKKEPDSKTLLKYLQ